MRIGVYRRLSFFARGASSQVALSPPLGEWPEGLLGSPVELGPVALQMDALLQSRKPKLLVFGARDEVTTEDLLSQCFQMVRLRPIGGVIIECAVLFLCAM